MSKRIKFKSIPDNWNKEYLGLKCNTIRKFNKDEDDVRFDIILDNIDFINEELFIEITNTQTLATFFRRVSDITRFEDCYVISWKGV